MNYRIGATLPGHGDGESDTWKSHKLLAATVSFSPTIVMQVYKVLYVLSESGKESFLSVDVKKCPLDMITVSVCHWTVGGVIRNTQRWKPDKHKKVYSQFTWTACVESTALHLVVAWPETLFSRIRLPKPPNGFWFPSWNKTGPTTILLQGQGGSSCVGVRSADNKDASNKKRHACVTCSEEIRITPIVWNVVNSKVSKMTSSRLQAVFQVCFPVVWTGLKTPAVPKILISEELKNMKVFHGNGESAQNIAQDRTPCRVVTMWKSKYDPKEFILAGQLFFFWARKLQHYF